MSSRSDWATGERLIALRLLLEEAQTRSTLAAPTDRHTSLVLLDGACELAMGLGLDQLGAARPKRDRFEDLFAVLAEKLGSGWAKDGWAGVRLLHRARNEAQHHGLRSDADQLVAWSSEAGSFVHSLVEAAFGVRLDTVTRAASVLNPDVRADLERAETALASGEADEAVEYASAAFRTARAAWKERRRAAGAGGVEISPFDNLTSPVIKQALEGLEKVSEIQAFAPDLSDFIWFEQRWRYGSHSPPASIDEAGRAVAFVFSWVLRWEAFVNKSAVPKEIFDHWKAERPPSSSKPHLGPRIVDGSVTATTIYGAAPELELTASLQVVDAPPAVDFDEWHGTLSTVLRDRWLALDEAARQGNAVPHVSRTGVVAISNLRPDAKFDVLVDLVREALDEVARQMQQRRVAAAEWAERDVPLLEEVARRALLPLRHNDIEIFDDIRLARPGGEDLEPTLEEHVLVAHFSPEFKERWPHLGYAQTILNRRDIRVLDDEVLLPDAVPGDLGEFFARALAEVDERQATEQRRTREILLTRTTAEERLLAAIRARGEGPPSDSQS